MRLVILIVSSVEDRTSPPLGEHLVKNCLVEKAGLLEQALKRLKERGD
jgi:hypothetical protein